MMIQRLALLLLLLCFSATVEAQRFNQKKNYDSTRYQQWEVSLLVQGQSGTDEAFEGGSSLEIDGEWGWGLTIGWNWTERLNLAYKFTLVKPGYAATIVPEDPDEIAPTIDYSMSKYAHQLNLTYHFLKGPLTPYIQAGAGMTKLDSNVPNRPPATGCWWDPWWGWICVTEWSTYETTELSYNVGLGLRWDLSDAFFVRGSYNREFVSLDSGDLDFDTLSLEAGLMW